MSCCDVDQEGAQNGSVFYSMCVCGLGGIREEEEEGDPICLFCPPDVSESRLRDLA